MSNNDIDKEKQAKLIIEAAPDKEKATNEQTSANAERPTLKDVIRERATEEELPLSQNFTLPKILGGDIFSTSTIRRQIWVLLLITFFMIIYISNRYSCQKDLIELDNLTQKLEDAEYKALSSSSQLTEKSRESHVLELLKTNKDSMLHIPNQPPYIINVPNDGE